MIRSQRTQSVATRYRGASRVNFLRGVACALVAVAAALAPRPARGELPPDERAEVDRAIVRALEYLAAQQAPSGAWTTDAYGECTGVTSLSVMAFMAAGHLPGEGPYGQQLNRAIRWILSRQEDNGMIVDKRSHGPMYSHGISTLMLAEAAGMTNEADATDVRRALERAVKVILAAQSIEKDSRHAGGWRYQIDSRDSDLSVTVWQVLALRAAKDIGCDVPAESIDRAIAYIQHCSVVDHRGFGYQPGSGHTPTLTGTGITALEVCGRHLAPQSVGGADWLLERPLARGDNYYFYGVYYTGVGSFKMGEPYAEQTYRHLIGLLLPTQEADGSWESPHAGERVIGRAYSTSLGVLSLAIEYRYLPIYQR